MHTRVKPTTTKPATKPASRRPRREPVARKVTARAVAPAEFTPFGRTAPVLSISESDADLLREQPESLRILVPASKLFGHE
jgi:hypothetical protein